MSSYVVRRFIGQLLTLLVCSNEKFGPQIQKHVKELVGHELNSHIYPILFDRCKAFVDKFFDASGQVISTLFSLHSTFSGREQAALNRLLLGHYHLTRGCLLNM